MAKQQHNAISDRLARAGTQYHREAERCVRGKAYLAAIVMQVCVLEASLQAMCSIYSADVKKTATYQKKKFRKKRNRVLEFTLNQLINIAREVGWFPPKVTTWGGRRTDLAGFAHEIRNVRNLVHPSVMIKDGGDRIRFSKAQFDAVFEVFDVANSWLLHRINQRLLKKLERENKRSGSRGRAQGLLVGPL
jgi:hypothetical protein